MRSVAIALVLFAVACGPKSDPPPAASPLPDDARVTALADAYLAGYFERNPEQSTYYGVPGHHHDRLSDNSLSALKAWEAREDAWLAEARTIEPSRVQSAGLRSTYASLRERLESAVDSRVCRSELWNVSQMSGWHVDFGYLITIQPVGTDSARAEALARWQQLPGFLDAEIVNLREGIRLGYTAPKLNVRIVVGQIDALLNDRAGSPFLSPASRDKTPEFSAAFSRLYTDRIEPAMRRYRDFLEQEYLPAARETIGVAANPDGARCYAASVRAYSTLAIQPEEVHATGLREIERLMAEMRAIGERSFGVTDVPALMTKVRTDKAYLFKSRQELVSYSQTALERAKAAMPDWFGIMPKAGVSIEPYPAYREKNAPGEYNPPAEDGSRPGLFYVNAYLAERQSRAPAESTAFHETIPGHHLQIAIAVERTSGHPIGRYIGNSGFSEGWGLYAERLADEMGLYSGDLDRLGMLSSQAFRASRLVIDSGLHAKGWTRQQAIDYMLAHTAEEPTSVAAEIDRYIIMPGQATAYMLGMLQIRDAREQARQAMGPRFDIKAFHDRVLEDGGVPVMFLTEKIRSWAMMPQ